ncbi:MAG: cytochrome c biogenesis protein CcsA [Planctomycetota bacterium]
MQLGVNTILVLLPVLYCVVGMGYAHLYTRKSSGLASHARALLLGTVALHLLFSLLRGLQIGSCPVASPAEFCSLVAFCIALIYVGLEMRTSDRSTGVFILLAVFLMQVIASVFILSHPQAPERTLGMLTSLHAATAVLSLSGIVVASIYGLLYLCLYTAIKSGRFGLFYQRMPSLEALSLFNSRAAWIGFLALSVTLFCGYFTRSGELSMVARVGAWSAEVLLTWAAWLLYGGCLAAHRVLHVGGKRLAYSTLLGLLLVLSILAVGLLEEGFHG